MFWTRFASAIVLAPLFLAMVYLGYPYFHILVAAIAGVMAWEFARMDSRAGTKRRLLIMCAAVAAVAVMSIVSAQAALLVVVVATVAVVAADQIAGRGGLNIVQAAIAYVAIPAVALLFVLTEGGAVSIFWLLAVVWGTDIGAYICGRLIGGPKLAPSISPKKTWSGAIGGLVIGVVASSAVVFAMDPPVTGGMIAMAVLVSVASQAGDLFESALKRRYQVKDSGGIIPGHGGVMDRFDGLWAAAPVTALLLIAFKGGVQQW